MKDKIYMTAEEVGQRLGISKSHAYKIVRELNQGLRKEGYIVIAGRLPTRYFEKCYYGANSTV